MLPPAIAVVRSTTDLMNTKLLPQKTATLKRRRSATTALRRVACVRVAGVGIGAILSPAERLGARGSVRPRHGGDRRRRAAAPRGRELDHQDAGEDERRAGVL